MMPVTARDTVRFWRSLRTHLWERHRPVLSGLEEVARELEGTPFEQGARFLVQRLEAGASLSEAMEAAEDLFPESVVCTVRTGEARGTLDHATDRILESVEDGTFLPPGAEADPDEEPVRFWRAFGRLLGAGVPILTTLDVLGSDIAHGDLRESARVMARAITEGETLASALRDHPELFAPEVVAAVSEAEENGTLDEAVLAVACAVEAGDLALLEDPRSAVAAEEGGGADDVATLLGTGLGGRAEDVRVEFFPEDGGLRFRIEGLLRPSPPPSGA